MLHHKYGGCYSPWKHVMLLCLAGGSNDRLWSHLQMHEWILISELSCTDLQKDLVLYSECKYFNVLSRKIILHRSCFNKLNLSWNYFPFASFADNISACFMFARQWKGRYKPNITSIMLSLYCCIASRLIQDPKSEEKIPLYWRRASKSVFSFWLSDLFVLNTAF